MQLEEPIDGFASIDKEEDITKRQKKEKHENNVEI